MQESRSSPRCRRKSHRHRHCAWIGFCRTNAGNPAPHGYAHAGDDERPTAGREGLERDLHQSRIQWLYDCQEAGSSSCH
ncbi:hypothetical protein ACQJBY_056475 [Aegilops geniculata]